MMFTIATPPPAAVNESCIALTAPVDVPVVDAAKSAESAGPKRTSLPSIAAPTACGTAPAARNSAAVSSPTASTHSVPMTARIARPCRASPMSRPKVRGSEKGMTSRRKTWNRLTHADGPSKGCAEFAL